MRRAIKKTIQWKELNQLAKDKHRFYAVRIDKQKQLLDAAKQLHALVYMDLGFIDENDVSQSGHISESSDPHQSHADYFAVIDKNDNSKRVHAAARQIFADENKQYNSFPILEKAKLHESIKSKIFSYAPKEIVEISALVKAPGVSSLAPLILYKAMFDRSLSKNHKIWLMALDTSVYEKFNYHFGSVLKTIGDISSYQGGDVVPLMMHTDQVFHVMEKEMESSRFLKRRFRKLLLEFFKSDLSFEFKD